MDTELKNALYERGANIVRFVDISELPTEQTQGFPKAILFCMVLSRKFITDMRNDLQTDHDEFVEKEQKTDELADWIAAYINQKGYRAYSQSEKNNMESGNYDEKTRSSILPHKTIARTADIAPRPYQDKSPHYIKPYLPGILSCELVSSPISRMRMSPRALKPARLNVIQPGSDC